MQKEHYLISSIDYEYRKYKKSNPCDAIQTVYRILSVDDNEYKIVKIYDKYSSKLSRNEIRMSKKNIESSFVNLSVIEDIPEIIRAAIEQDERNTYGRI